MIGAATLVPPSTIHAEVVSESGPYTATPVLGSATAEISSNAGLLASTSSSLQLRHIALTMSRSSADSSSHPRFEAGKLLVVPVWFTFRKQPLAVVHAGNPNCARYTARSASAFG